jgi:hypothetical protein
MTSHVKVYGAYNFRTKDPAIDGLRTLIQQEKGKLNRKALRDIETAGGASASAMHEWFFGKTRRPQNAGLEAAGRALGYERGPWQPMNGKKRNGKAK